MLKSPMAPRAIALIILSVMASNIYFNFHVAVMTVVFLIMHVGSIICLSEVFRPEYNSGSSIYTVSFFEETAARIASIFHVLVTVPEAILYLLGYVSIDTWVGSQKWTMAYLLVDALYLTAGHVVQEEIDYGMLLHHAVFYIGINTLPTTYEWYIALAYLAELSNPFLYAAWYMHKTGLNKKRPITFACLTLCLLVVFAICRVVNFSWLLWYISKHDTVGMILCIPLWAMNVWWFYKLLKRVVSELLGKTLIQNRRVKKEE